MDPAAIGPFSIYRRSPWAEVVVLRGMAEAYAGASFVAALRPDPDQGPQTDIDVVATPWAGEDYGEAGDLIVTLNLSAADTAVLSMMGRGDLKVIIDPDVPTDPWPVAAWSWTLERDVTHA